CMEAVMVREFAAGLVAVTLVISGCGESKVPATSVTISMESEEPTIPEQDEPLVTATTEQPTVVVKLNQDASPPETAFDRLCKAYTTGDADGWAAAEKEILDAGSAATPSLVAALTDGTEHQRELAASLLAQTGAISPPAKAALRKAISDESAFVRANAVAALCAIGDVFPELIATIEELLGREEQESKLMAIMSLGNLGPAAASLVPKIIPVLDDSNSELRRAATAALGQIGAEGKVALEKLQVLAADDPDAEIRQSATNSIALIRGETASDKADSTNGGRTEVIPASSSKEIDE
ncbi:MAG: HEAT repeat domain-containing protein, partial [Planctomycetaceae bacterium]